MYRLDDIVSGLYDLVGWRQSYSPKKRIDDALTVSHSGLHFQDAHPLLTLENMAAIMPDDMRDSYAPWKSEKKYHSGEGVFYDDTYWRAVRDNTGVAPGTQDDCWSETDILSDYLRTITRTGIIKTVQTFITSKVQAGETRNLLENKSLFDGTGRYNDIVPNRGCLVGFEIVPLRQQGITMTLNRIGLQMRSANGTVHLYLFHSSSADPIAAWDVKFNNNRGDFSWLDFAPADFAVSGFDARSLDTLPYLTSSNDGGSYYLVYHQSELPKWMDAINYARDWSKEPCMSCNRGNLREWREMTKYVRLSPFRVKCEDFPTNHKLWDIADMVYTPETNYGINFRYSIGCDISDFIISQRDIFANALQLQVAYTALKTLLSNPSVRVNREQINAAQLLYDLDGDSGGRPSGIGHELRNAYKALAIDTTGIAKVCLGCTNKGVSYGFM